ncbi:MAG TPA: hypothetical protein VF546_06905 [Pyrinomonadaceae bacterium]|jgi:hypothetical protein
MPKDYLPQGDTELVSFLENLLAKGSAAKGKLGLDDDALAELTTLTTTFKTSVTEAQQAQTTLDAKIQAKRLAREAVETSVRARVRLIQAQPGLTDADRAELRLPARDTSRTPAGAPATRPVLTVDTSERLRHRLDYRDSATPRSRAKPRGVAACQIYRFVGPNAPTDPAQFTLLTVDQTTPHTVQYNGADAGHTAHYLARWVSTQDETGPWSDTVSATITG